MGRLTSVWSLLDDLAELLTIVVMQNIYRATLDSVFPQAVFVIMAAVTGEFYLYFVNVFRSICSNLSTNCRLHSLRGA
jgi:hypothetical protein